MIELIGTLIVALFMFGAIAFVTVLIVSIVYDAFKGKDYELMAILIGMLLFLIGAGMMVLGDRYGI